MSADHQPDNIKAHLFMDHGWDKPFGWMTDRELRAIHDALHPEQEEENDGP